MCTKEGLEVERKHLQEVFEANGYPPALVQKTLAKHSRQQVLKDSSEETKQDILCLPYIRGFSEEIEKAIKDLHVRAVFKSQQTLRKLLMKVKSPRSIQTERCGILHSL